MAIWQVDIAKVEANYHFTNVYHVDALSQAAAIALADAIVLLEKAVYSTYCTFVKARVQQTVPAAASGYTYPLTGAGTRNITTSEYLPLWDVVRVDFYPASGRSSRKYLRLLISEAENNNATLTTAFLAVVNTGYTNPLLATAGFCDPQGQPFVRAATWPNVAMRQLRRGSKRRLSPVI